MRISIVRPGPWVALAGALALALVLLSTGCSDREAGPATSTATRTATAGSATASGTATAATPATPTATATRPATGTAVPTPTPAPPTATPTRPAPTEGRLITNGDRGSGLVALTLDMGGRVDPALDIMHWLIDNHVRATIFMTGAMADNQNTGAGREVLRLVDAHPELFELGNHSYSHPDFRELDAAGMKDELDRAAAAMAPYCSQDPAPLFRPPFGGVDARVVAGAAAAGYPYTITWDVDTIDWNPESEGGPTTAQIVQKVLGNARGGSIVLMHLGGYHTFEALPQIVDGLRAKGLGFATVGQLIGE